MWARSPPVPTTSTAAARPTCTRGVWRSIAVGEAGDLRGGLALGAQRDDERGDLRRRRVARMIWSIAHAVSSAVRSGRDQLARAGRARSGLRGGVPCRAAQPRTAGSSAAAAAQHVGDGLGRGQRVERVDDHRVGLRPGREPAVVPAAHRDDDRRAVGDLVLELPGQAHPAGGLRLAVEDREVDLARVDRREHLGDPARLDVAHPAVRGGTAADGRDDGLADLGTVAEHQHGGVALT